MRKLFFLLFVLNFNLCFSQTFDDYMNTAATKMQENDLKGTINAISKAIDHSKNVSDIYKIADAYIARGQLRMLIPQNDLALKDFLAAQKLVPEYSKAYFAEGTLWLKSKKYTKAIIAANKCLKLNPTNFEYIELKCNGYEYDLKFEKSLSLIDSFMLVNNESIAGLYIKARSLSGLKKNEESKNVYTRILELSPKNTDALFNRAVTKGLLKDYKGAEEDNLFAAQIDTASAWIAYNNIGFFVKLCTSDWKGAVEYFDKAIKLNGNRAYSYSNRGWAKFNLGDEKGAKADMKKSLEIDPSNAYAYKYQAQMCVAQGKVSDACKNLNKAEELNYTILYDDEVKVLMEKHCK